MKPSVSGMKAILFDFGGTIDTDGVHWSEKFWEYYEKYDLPVAKKDLERAFMSVEQQLAVKDCSNLTFLEVLHEQLSKQFVILGIQENDELLQSLKIACYQDVVRTIDSAKIILEMLSKRYKLGVVSNFYGNLEIVCREFGLDEYMGAMIDSVSVGVRKPDPRIFSLALRKLGVGSQETFVVGDSYDRDIVPAKHLGCTTVWLKGKSWTTPTDTSAADFAVQHFQEIRKILLSS